MTTTTIPNKFVQRCSRCHSKDVVLDAWACWSFDRQAWELGQTFDHAYCEACESDCTIEAIEIASPPAEPAPFIQNSGN